ncbi:hypothetical protein CDG77_11370, partial [Nostoc sp. 'Peltigera membranacea cyanobiont' 213]|uniref:hypothetical protein n=1 Tax=Nostoc sp. 'Peltigera membranacea cyanobiont' 213 TaxID=2014530 RepID=UPI000B9F5BF4
AKATLCLPSRRAGRGWGWGVMTVVSITNYADMISSLIPLEKLVLEGYLAGLRSAGWNGDECVVCFTYAALGRFL